MVPLIGAATLAVLGVKWASNLGPDHRVRLLNNLNQFSAAAGVLSRLMTTVDAFRLVVEWTDQWPRDDAGRVIPGARIGSPPIGVPAPVSGNNRPNNQPPATNPASPMKQGVAMTNAALDFS